MKYRNIKFHKKNLVLIKKVKEILEEYEEQGIKVTLRQLYYQLVSRDIIPNTQKEYSKLSKVLTDARYSDMVSWDAIEDRVRIPEVPNTFMDIKHLLEVACRSYQLDRWKEQEYYIELWTEKDAISSVIQPLCEKYQVTLSVNRGYTSASAMYKSAERIKDNCENKECIILYLGDHDPSGLDMDRDIQDRLTEFDCAVAVLRIGLTQKQIKKYTPPPNPAKITDPRAKEYIKKFGDTSWEVDALEPQVLQKLVEDTILIYLDLEKYEQVQEQEKKDIKVLKKEGGGK